MVRERNRVKGHEVFSVTKLTEEILDEYVESIEVHPGNETYFVLERQSAIGNKIVIRTVSHDL